MCNKSLPVLQQGRSNKEDRQDIANEINKKRHPFCVTDAAAMLFSEKF